MRKNNISHRFPSVGTPWGEKPTVGAGEPSQEGFPLSFTNFHCQCENIKERKNYIAGTTDTKGGRGPRRLLALPIISNYQVC